jgi:hypothetical protein
MDGPVRWALGVAGARRSGRGVLAASSNGATVGRRGAGGKAPTGALVVVVLLAVAGLLPTAAHAQAPVDTAPIVIEGVQLRQVLGTAAPLYVTRGVSDEKARWMGDAIDIALTEVPRITGLPLPQNRLEFYLFEDPQELVSLSGQILRSPGPRVSPECFALAVASTPRRGIYCQADSWDSASEALDYVSHELTHQVQQGDSGQRRGLAQWFNEGLAEYVQGQVTAKHSPSYSARDRWRREAQVASALHNGRLVRLRDLSTNQRWQQAAGSGWAGLIYSESSLVISYLVDTYGLPAVVDVVQRTGGPIPFDAVFQEVFGVGVDAVDRDARAALESDLLNRYPIGLSAFQSEGPAGGVFHFAVVGFQPQVWLEKDYRDESGATAATTSGGRTRQEPQRTDRSGFASWSWTSAPDATTRTVQLTVRGSDGSEASQSTTLVPTR